MGIKDTFEVLIVDEDHELCRALSQVLVTAGYGVECLSASSNPFSAIRKIDPDLLIFDVAMPEVRGLETLRRLQAHRATRKIPVIVTSPQAELEYELLDVYDFLPKPLDERRLLEDLGRLAKSPQGRDPQAPYPPLGDGEFGRFQDYLILHSGLHFDRRNSKILERGLMRRMRAVGARDYRDYFAYLETYAESRQELKKLLGLLTIGETYFFRYLAHFKALAGRILPEIIQRKRSERTLRIWTAGCSTGEEPYSIAMLLLEMFPLLADWQVSILATDINQRSMRCARDGVYGERSLRVTEPLFRDRYFQRHGSSYVLDPRVRDMVDFGYFNLQTGDFPSPENGTSDIDIIFCRNVMIYFRLATTRHIVEKFSRCLRPGGYLFLGHAETLINISEDFDRVQEAGGFYYRLPLEGARAAKSPSRRPKPPVPVAPPKPRPPRPVAKPPSPPPASPSPKPDLDEVFRRAEEAFDREEFKTASKEYDIILRCRPAHRGALIGKGFLCANRGRFEEALEYCRLALEADDLCPDAYFLRGLILEFQEDLETAVAEYRKALLLDMDMVMPHYNLSKLYLRMGRQGDARRELNNTVRLLEKIPEEAFIPHSGGLSRAVFLEVCREDVARLGEAGSAR
ncbi:CheR family methyltransferase [uncultured Desulfuromonas sp.]|uniref:CheR family methyltransferase n=1 Tax=uncultured Desulfuromonas sp. TaxID=181013 RepID=UPI00260A9CF3|nr:CheR family methyltransferase [uncultured Desulfuromonas sp.]